MKDYFFKVHPVREFTDQANVTRIVVGIAVRITSNIVFALSGLNELTFFVEFLLSTGSKFGGLNVKMSEFVTKAVAQGATEEQAAASLLGVVQSLIFGTVEQKYAAAGILAGMYNYTLAPLSEQNGDPLFIPPTPEPEE
jgi:hypothetical protein